MSFTKPCCALQVAEASEAAAEAAEDMQQTVGSFTTYVIFHHTYPILLLQSFAYTHVYCKGHKQH